MAIPGNQTQQEGKPQSRIRPVLLVLLWIWAILVFVVVDLLLDVEAFDRIRPESDFYRSLRAAGHDMSGTPGAELIDAEELARGRGFILEGAFEDPDSMIARPANPSRRSPRRPRLVSRNGQNPLRHGTYAQWSDPGGVPGKGEYKKRQREGEWVWTWADGSKRETRHYTGGRLDGFVRSWYPNGTPEVEEEYKAGKPNGTWRWWHSNGELGAEQQFADGKLHGRANHWHADGKRYAEVSYFQGSPDATFCVWHPNGVRAEAGEFFQGKRIGVWTRWDTNGRVITEAADG